MREADRLTGGNPGRPANGPRLKPAEVEARLDAAATHYAAGRTAEAARDYAQIEARNPDDFRAVYSLATIDLNHGRLRPALRRLERVVRLEPKLFSAQHNLGFVRQSLGLWDGAAAAYARALALNPDAFETTFNLATALAVLGRIDAAIEQYRALAALPPHRLRALSGLALLRPGAITDHELADLEHAAWDSQSDPARRIGPLFALGEVLEDRRRDDDAFAAFAAGNRLNYDALAADPDPAVHPAVAARAHAQSIERVRALFTPAFLAPHAGGGDATARPIFIVGMPRSGSTLIEQILASHPAVRGMGESEALSETLDAHGAYDPAHAKDAALYRGLAEDYLARMRERGWRPRSRLADKTLESWLHVGMIHLMFPRAVILHSVRDPVDTGLACYRQLFGRGNETLYDLGQIGAEYVGYRAMMDHWSAVLPGRVIDVRHEALVADPEAQIRWLVTEACGLPWDPACLDFHRTERPVITASIGQVRQPIFTTSIARWRRYERHLGPLLVALGPFAP